MILGDNIYHGNNLTKILREANEDQDNSTVFTYQVKDPERFGILTLNKDGLPSKIQEKPKLPKSNLAITGLYFFPKNVSVRAKKLKPSKRGELEITDINKAYLQRKKLQVKVLDRGTAWLDTGTFSSLMQAAQYVQVMQERQGLRIGAIEEVALQMGYISTKQFEKVTKPFQKSGYAKLKSNGI